MIRLTHLKRFIYTFFIFILIFVFERVSEHKIDILIDKMFLIKKGQYFDETILGELAFRVNDANRIYVVKYFSDIQSGQYEKVPLTAIVDVSTWKEVKSNELNTRTFEDSKHIYRLYLLEDIFINCAPK